MFSRIVSLIILVPLAVVLVVFCIANSESVTISLDPLGTMPQFAFEAPLFIVLMATLIVGVLIGGVATWISQARHRRHAARRRNEIDRLKREQGTDKAKLRELQLERDRAVSGDGGQQSTAIAGPGARAA